ncbi:hypothetical protein A4A49_12719 [Nicotiana attenuata]|uniref:Retrovirus-related pol polyprotein from transposon tnt 1-94 n=1 Tax=Nicotiana attenuata TaxID=49451 RepID=A0A314KNU6_NICAT|nr:hypothetical protein A4A49_12719 [Nicotiana attenuata]
MQLKSQIQNLPKGNLSITEYFEKKRAIADSLAESLYFVQDDDFISFVLNGLDSSFSIFKAAFNMRSGPITPEELFGLLFQEKEHLAEELRSTTVNTHFGSAPSHALLTYNSSYPASPLNTNQSSILGPPPLFNHLAHNPQNHAQSTVPQQHSHTSFSRSNNRQSKRRVQCQIYGKNNHDARNCYNHSNEKDFPPTRQPPSRSTPKQAHLASPSTIVDPAWYFDSGATHHVTSDMANLSLQADYTGNDGLAVGNGMKLPISHIGSSILSTPTRPIYLNNILHVPQISKNLLSVSEITRDNNVHMDFHPYDCYVKDLQGWKLLRGTLDDGLYRLQLSSPHSRSSPPSVFLGEHTSLVGWQRQLAHPNEALLRRYSSHHKGYLCYHVVSSQIYITRHVVFDENIFPYSSMLPTAKSSSSSSHSSNSSFSYLIKLLNI